MLDNQGFREKSEVSEKERVEFAAYRAELEAVLPINSNEAAMKLRGVLAKYYPQLIPTMKELKLKY
jgi:hypothetical protein